MKKISNMILWNLQAPWYLLCKDDHEINYFFDLDRNKQTFAVLWSGDVLCIYLTVHLEPPMADKFLSEKNILSEKTWREGAPIPVSLSSAFGEVGWVKKTPKLFIFYSNNQGPSWKLTVLNSVSRYPNPR